MLPFANIIAVNCSFDLLEDGTTELVGYRGFTIRRWLTMFTLSSLHTFSPFLHISSIFFDRS